MAGLELLVVYWQPPVLKEQTYMKNNENTSYLVELF